MIFHENAEAYIRKGFSVIPVEGKISGIPAWNIFRDDPADEVTLNDWLSRFPKSNIALILGKASGVSAFDIDISLETVQGSYIYNALKDLFPYSPCKKAGKKAHTAFYAESSIDNWTINMGEYGRVEFFSGNPGAKYVVIPPSIHPETNQPYVWLDKSLLDVPKDFLPPFPSEIKNKILARLKELEIEVGGKNQKTCSRNDKLKSIVWAMLSRGESPTPILTEVIRVDLKDHTPPLFSDPDEPQMRRRSHEDNAKRFVDSIVKTFHNFKKLSDSQEEKKQKKPTVNFISDIEIRDGQAEKLNWLIDGFLPAIGTSLFISKPKAGKSTLVRQMASNIAAGEPFLNRTTTKGRVLYLAIEDHRTQLKTIFQSHHLTMDGSVLYHCGPVFQADYHDIEEAIKEHFPVAVIIDTLQKFLRIPKINDYDVVLKCLEPYFEMANKYKMHFCFVHHASKSKDKEGQDLTLGSTGLNASMDCIVILDNKNDTRSIESTQRYGEPFFRTELIYDNETYVTKLGDRADKAKIDELQNTMLSVIKGSFGGITKEELFAKVSGRNQSKWQALNALSESMRITHSGSGIKSDPKRYLISKV